MINRRFMIVPPALPSGGHAEPLEQTSKDFLCLLLEMANMRVLLSHRWHQPNTAQIMKTTAPTATAARTTSIHRLGSVSKRVSQRGLTPPGPGVA